MLETFLSSRDRVDKNDLSPANKEPAGPARCRQADAGRPSRLEPTGVLTFALFLLLVGFRCSCWCHQLETALGAAKQVARRGVLGINGSPGRSRVIASKALLKPEKRLMFAVHC